jgi:hypothetical protein
MSLLSDKGILCDSMLHVGSDDDDEEVPIVKKSMHTNQPI